MKFLFGVLSLFCGWTSWTLWQRYVHEHNVRWTADKIAESRRRYPVR